MKRFFILISILIITVATLCGCNRDNESNKSNVSSNASENISEETSDNQKDVAVAKGTNEVIDSNQKTDINNHDISSATYSKDSTMTGHYDVPDENNNVDNKNTSENSTSSSPSNDEVHEAEIDFSELE